MSKKQYDNKTQRNLATPYEIYLCDYYGIKHVGKNEKKYDGIRNNFTVEIKVDFKTVKYGNVFFEEYSNVSRGKVIENYGGPWKAKRDNVSDFWSCLVFSNHIKILKYKPVKIVSFIEKIIVEKNLDEKFVWNKGYDTSGWAVPLNLVKGNEYHYEEIPTIQ